MNYHVSHPSKKLAGSILLTASKSESNRALIIQALCAEKFEIENLAAAQDTVKLQEILSAASKQNISTTHDVGPAGTAMRFLTAYFSTQPGTHILTGSDRMKKRPIGILVNALRELGAQIEYLEEEGFPPLKITGTQLKGGEVEMDGSVSSQFISALLMIAPELQNGLVIKFKGDVISRPYINMTFKMMEEFRVYGQWQTNSISVSRQAYHKKSEADYKYKVEADWSSASYWYAMVALCEDADMIIKGLKHPSLHGDAIIADVFTFFGVKTEYISDGVRITKNRVKDEHFGFDFSDCPDIAQTAAVVVSAMGIPALFNGLQTLRIKETDRIEALKRELKKIGTDVKVLDDSCIQINPAATFNQQSVSISTYDDHRMAMAFAALALKMDSVIIENAEVVKKSYPGFWEDLKSMGFAVKEVPNSTHPNL
ncbi:MAG TPA: 3-phosphoshikimate 1-carboxyvinyltransferase [Bacteroidia bacterium]|jgi:3-phosphoshikimate 1-carboxyvinyltransferase